MPSPGRYIADFLIRARYPLLLIAVIAGAAAIVPSTQLDFDRSIENMVERNDRFVGRSARSVFRWLGVASNENEGRDLVAPYKKLKRTFGGNEIVMVVYHDDDLMAADGSGIDRLGRLSKRLRQVAGVQEALSLAEIDHSLKQLETSLRKEVEALPAMFQVAAQRFVAERVVARSIVAQDSKLAARFRKLFAGYTHGADGKTAAIVCMLLPEDASDVPRRKTIDNIRSAIGKDGLPANHPEVMIAGEPVMVVDGFRYVEEDGQRLGWSSTVLLALTIIVCFRSIRWVIIPISVVQLTLVLTRAILVWGNLQMSMVSSMLTAIVTVVGVATVVHVIVRYREARFNDLDKRKALRQAITLLAIPVFWACTTDAVGFSSLLVTNVGPVRDFGVMMAIGSLLVLLSVALLLAGLALLRLPKPLARFDADPQRAWSEDVLDRQLGLPLKWVDRRPIVLGGVLLLAAAVMALGVFRTEVESDFTKNFRASSPLVRSYDFVETNLGGAGVWDVVLPAPDDLNWEYLHQVALLERKLRDEVGNTSDGSEGLTKVISIVDIVTTASPVDLESALFPREISSRIMGRIALSFFRGLEGSGEFESSIRNRIVARILSEMRTAMPVYMSALYGNDPEDRNRYYYRIMLRASERQSSGAKQQLINQVRQIVDQQLQTSAWKELLAGLPTGPDNEPAKAEVTGFFVLLTFLVDSMLADQWKAFAVAAFFIALMMFVAFRNPLQAIVALVPNATPIVMVLGMMGWLGIKINMGAAMIAAVSMGLSIDSAVHYITSFRRARSAGKRVHESLVEVQQQVGRALFFSTLALIVGFMVLCFSHFVPTIYFGVLVSLSMLGGLFGNLLVLPLLLTLVSRDR